MKAELDNFLYHALGVLLALSFLRSLKLAGRNEKITVKPIEAPSYAE